MLVAFAYMGIGLAEETPYEDCLIADYYIDFFHHVSMQFYDYMEAHVLGRHLCAIELPSGWDFLVHRFDDTYVSLEVFPMSF